MRCNGTLSLVVAAIFMQTAVSAANAASPVEVGQTAPNFTLRDQKGEETSLAKLVKQQPVALVFYRSADW